MNRKHWLILGVGLALRLAPIAYADDSVASPSPSPAVAQSPAPAAPVSGKKELRKRLKIQKTKIKEDRKQLHQDKAAIQETKQELQKVQDNQ